MSVIENESNVNTFVHLKRLLSGTGEKVKMSVKHPMKFVLITLNNNLNNRIYLSEMPYETIPLTSRTVSFI